MIPWLIFNFPFISVYFPGGASGKEPACQCKKCWETWIWSLGGEDPLEEEMATHSSILAGKIPWTEEPAHGAAKELDMIERLNWLQYVGTKLLQSCPTLCRPKNCSPPAVHGILQARILEWVAISFSNAWKWKVEVKSRSRVRLLATSMDCLTPSFPVHHQLPELSQTHVHRVSDAI